MQTHQRSVLLGRPEVLRSCQAHKIFLAHVDATWLSNLLPFRQSRARKLQQELGPLVRNNTKLYSKKTIQDVAGYQTTSVTGSWKKSPSQSDDMQEACDMVELSWVLRKALKLLDNLEVDDSPEVFQTKIKAGGIMDVVERYSWSGLTTEHKRRDKRRGIHRGKVQRTETGPQISVEWDDPFGGKCLDTFQVSSDNQTLTQTTEMTMLSGKLCKYRTVYHRVNK